MGLSPEERSEPDAIWSEPPQSPASAPLRTYPIAVIGFCAMLNLHAPQPLLPLLSQSFPISPTEAALTMGVAAIGVGLAAPFAGAVSDAYGRRAVVVVANFGIALPTLAAALVPTFELLLLCRFIQGLLVPAFFTAVLAYVAEEWEPNRSGRITGVYVTATVVSGFAGRFIAGSFAELGGWRLSFVALGLVNLAGALLVWWTMSPSRNFVRTPFTMSAVSGFAANLRNGPLLAACAVGFATMFTFLGLFTYLTFYLSAPPFNLGPTELGAVFLAYLLGATTTPYAGRLIDRFGPKRVVILSGCVAAFGVAATTVPSLPVIMVGLVACCAGVFACNTCCMIYTSKNARSGRSAAAGFYLTFYYGGAGLGAWLPGLAYLSFGWIGCVALLFTVQAAATLSAALTWRIPRAGDEARQLGEGPQLPPSLK